MNSSINIKDHAQVLDFLNRVCSKVRSKHSAQEIRLELLSHIEDAIEPMLEQGTPLDQAILRVIEQFGEPGRLGTTLNKIHHPIHQIPAIRALVLFAFIVVNHYLFFGGHIGQMFEPKALTLTLLLGLLLTVLIGRGLEWRAALKSLWLPPSELPRTERVHAWNFFDRFSRIVQRLSIIVGVCGTIGMITVLYIYNRPEVIGAWLAMVWLAYFYGLVFGVLIAKLHAISVRTAHRNDSHIFQSRLTSEKASVFIQGLTPVLVIQALIGVISHVEVQNQSVLLLELTKIAYGLVLSVACVATLPLDSKIEQTTEGLGIVALRLKRSAPIFLTAPLFVIVTVSIILLAVWRLS